MFFMNIKIEAHSNDKFQKKLDAVPKWEVPESTKKEVYTFISKAAMGQVQEGKRLSGRTLSKYLSLLKHSLEIVNKPTLKITKTDIEAFDKKLIEKKLSSARDYRRVLKIFLRWKIGTDKSRKLAGWLDVRDKVKTPDYLTEIEISKLFKNTKNAPERFLISVLFDAGCRAEEFLNIRYEDIQLPEGNENFVKITLKEEYSKTLGRTISLYWKNSLNSVRDFLKEREQEGIKSSDPVFTSTYDGMRMFLARLGKKVLTKKVYPHLFRHSSATYYATKHNRQELCYRYGWKFSSDMPDIYISRAGMQSKELDEKFKSTELENVEKKMAIVKFENQKKLEGQKEEFKKEIEALKKDNQEITKNMEGIAEKMRGFVRLLKDDPKTPELVTEENALKIEEIFTPQLKFIKQTY